MSAHHPSALSAPGPGGNTAKTCHHCSPPLEFEKVGQKKAHYRVTHQSQTTITSPDNLGPSAAPPLPHLPPLPSPPVALSQPKASCPS